jgi:hypothetical protein
MKHIFYVSFHVTRSCLLLVSCVVHISYKLPYIIRYRLVLLQDMTNIKHVLEKMWRVVIIKC